MITKKAVFFSLLLHFTLVIIMLVNYSPKEMTIKGKNPPPKSITALAVDEELVKQEIVRLQTIENKAKLAKEKELKILKKEINRLKKKTLSEQDLIDKLKSKKAEVAKQREDALEKQKRELSKIEKTKRKVVEESLILERLKKERAIAEKRRLDSLEAMSKAEKKLAEKELRMQLESEEIEETEEFKKNLDNELLNRYAKNIKALVLQNFTILPGHEGLECTLRITLVRDGNIAGIKIVSSSNNLSFDRSAENAVRKVAPLPVPASDTIFEKMRSISIVFRP